MSLHLLADECCDGDLVLLLRQASHDVRYVAEGTLGEAMTKCRTLRSRKIEFC